MIKEFSIIISNTTRSVHYLRNLKKEKLFPNRIIYLDNKSKNRSAKILKKKKFFFKDNDVKVFLSDDITVNISKFILKEKIKFLIYSGYPGIIIKNKNLLKKIKIIHCHPGKLPDFRGSTPIYYSLLKKNKIYCSSMFLNGELDKGDIILEEEYPIPRNIFNIDKKYDDEIRAKHLIKTLKKSGKLNTKKQNDKSLPYYTIHPMLRSLCFKLKRK
tara:strand:- start:6063 stop:6707 length:645 start_codon:yes stop_codon:yes gene_type:complete